MKVLIMLTMIFPTIASTSTYSSSVNWIQPGPPPIAWDGCSPSTYSTDANPALVSNATSILSHDLGGIPFTSTSTSPRIRFHWTPTFPDNSSGLATTYPNIVNGHFNNADIYVRDYLSTWPYITRLLLHELGHAMGLAHSPDRSQLMYAQIGQSTPSDFTDMERYALASNVTCARGGERGHTVTNPPRLTSAVVAWRKVPA